MKTVIIGLDGATFDIINPLSQSGRLPFLSRLMKEGTSAPLLSTTIPNSFPGWASCTTGTSEGMHGVFSPFIKQPGSYGVRAMSGRDIMTRPVWDILGEQGGRSLLVNIPTTYPAEPVNGVMITGMLTPGLDSDFTFPQTLKEEMLAAIPAYVIEPGRNPDRQARIQEFRHANDMHELAVHFLMDRGDWDFLMVVFSVLDRAQHDFWADMDPDHPRHDPRGSAEFRGFIHEVYERLDAAIGRLIEKLPAETRVLVVSDHGFCSELKEVRVNEALSAAGLLSFRSGRRTRSGVREFKEKIGRRLGLSRSNGNVLDRKVQYGSAYLDEIDWARTRAYFAQDKGIWINLAGREREGIVPQSDFDQCVEEVREALSNLKLPDDGLAVFESIRRREEALSGRYIDRLPDLVMVPRRDELVCHERSSYGEVFVDADTTSGTHSRYGIFIAWGSGIKPSADFASPPNLRDIGGAALYSLGCPLTEDMDGRSLSEIFSEQQHIAPRGSSYREEVAGDSPSAYSTDEEAALRERLRALGYIE
jgi:predicted AlkP superfamily phosphohydrolase/phosphomutase